MQNKTIIVILTLLFAFSPGSGASDKKQAWIPVPGKIMTRWASQINPRRPRFKYPRPQMRRKQWLSLNGLWQYAIRSRDQIKPENFDGTILVPFPIESALSGVKKKLGKNKLLWYSRRFEIPPSWQKQKILLHIEASDWETNISVNGAPIGQNRGGYSPFYLDITDVLRKNGPQEITISVWDPCNDEKQPRGKQVTEPKGIWYTSVSGIWGSVWLEPVPQNHIRSVQISAYLDKKQVVFAVKSEGTAKNLLIKIYNGKQLLYAATGQVDEKNIVNLTDSPLKLWSPQSPFLYDVTITLINPKNNIEDTITTYFGMRKIQLAKDKAGITRLFLNNRFVFQYGTLDQGWWPDGLYTAPSDEALAYDIEVLKELGFNLIRKHVKVEPRRFYYWCDKLGMLVWQDMPNGGMNIGPGDPDPLVRPGISAQFEYELKNMVDSLYSHPSIIMWVVFNEGWGQYDTRRITQWLKLYDSTRLVNSASGWTDRGIGDVYDIHKYPGPGIPPADPKRALVLGEFGGLGFPVRQHTWDNQENWGYRNFKAIKPMNDAYENLLFNLHQLIPRGLSAAVYTQTTDVESEVNGIMTYDRKYIKFNPSRIKRIHQKLYEPPAKFESVVATSQIIGQEWKYTNYTPSANWIKIDFDDSDWQMSWGGFGKKGTPGAKIRTNWNSTDIYLRTKVKWQPNNQLEYYLKVHHDDNAQIYLNGHLTASLNGYTSVYQYFLIPKQILEKLHTGEVTIAVHCHQNKGGQYIDMGIVSVSK